MPNMRRMSSQWNVNGRNDYHTKTYKPEMYARPEDYNQSNNVSKQCGFLALSNFFMKNKRRFYKVLDVGCGDGAVTELLSHFLPRECDLSACDISEEMVEFAKIKFRHLGVKLFTLDICAPVPPELKGQYDLVFSNFILHWTPKIDAAVSSIYNLMAPGGQCLLTFIPNHYTWRVYRLLAKDPKWSKYMEGVEDWMTPYQDIVDPKQEFTMLLKSRGFRMIEVQHGVIDFKYDSFDQYKLLMRTVHPNIMNIPEHLRDSHMDTFMDYFVDIGGLKGYDPYSYDGGVVFVPYDIIIASATKC